MSNPIYDLMHIGESGATGYNAYNRGSYPDGSGRQRMHPPGPPRDFSQFTVGEIQEMQHRRNDDPERVFALGKYQIIPATMDKAINELRLDPNQPFTPELQDRIFTEYLLVDKRPKIRNFVEGNLD
jgi:hypothetical protein